MWELNGFIVFLQKLFLVCLAVVAAVSADVSHLNGGANGYNYPEPNPSFQEEKSQPISPPPAPPAPPVSLNFITGSIKSLANEYFKWKKKWHFWVE